MTQPLVTDSHLVKILFKEFHIVLICNLFNYAFAIMLLHKLDKLIVNRTVNIERWEIVIVNTVNITAKSYIIITKFLKAVQVCYINAAICVIIFLTSSFQALLPQDLESVLFL